MKLTIAPASNPHFDTTIRYHPPPRSPHPSYTSKYKLVPNKDILALRQASRRQLTLSFPHQYQHSSEDDEEEEQGGSFEDVGEWTDDDDDDDEYDVWDDEVGMDVGDRGIYSGVLRERVEPRSEDGRDHCWEGEEGKGKEVDGGGDMDLSGRDLWRARQWADELWKVTLRSKSGVSSSAEEEGDDHEEWSSGSCLEVASQEF